MDIVKDLGLEIKGRLSDEQASRIALQGFGDGAWLDPVGNTGGVSDRVTYEGTLSVVVGAFPDFVLGTMDRAVMCDSGHVQVIHCSREAARTLVRTAFPVRCRKCTGEWKEFIR